METVWRNCPTKTLAGMSFWNTVRRWNLICDVDAMFIFLFVLIIWNSLCDTVIWFMLKSSLSGKVWSGDREQSNNCLVSSVGQIQCNCIFNAFFLSSHINPNVGLFILDTYKFVNRTTITLCILFHSLLIQNTFHGFVCSLHKNSCLNLENLASTILWPASELHLVTTKALLMGEG